MYKVLYRKYRPRFFADVVDQPQVTVTLKNELTRGRIAHAYLFTGSRGTGKTTCAKILARAVNCLDPQNGDPCGECEVCRGLEDGSILDVVEIDAASNNGVDSIRSLIEESNFTPATAKYRVYIIDEVHMLSVAAFNALLKTLEEPPAHVIFILATTEVHKLLPTILSRCQRFDFRRISPEAIADRLEYVAGEEGAQLDRDAALLIARIADGAMRDALSLLDQCLGRDAHVTLETVNRTAGVAAREYLSTLAQAVAERDISAALGAIDELYRESKDMSRLCEEMAEYFRGLMLIKTMRDASGLVTVSAGEWETMNRQALAMSLSTILHGLDTFEETLNKMRYGNQRAQLEMAFVRLCSPELDTTPDALLRRLEALESGAPPRQRLQPAPAQETLKPVSQPAVEQPPVEPLSPEPKVEEISREPEQLSPEPKAEEIPLPPDPEEPAQEPEKIPEPELPPETDTFDQAPLPPEPPEAEQKKPVSPPPAAKPQPTVDIRALSAEAQRFRDWPEILQVIKNSTKSVAMAFSGSAAYVNGDYMLIDAPEIAFELLKRPEQRDRMREAIRHVTGRTYRLGPYRREETGEEADPLEELTRRAKDSGIEIQEETPAGEEPPEELTIPF
ncbi:DNA polymerase III subunit gamma/tau [uncultured Neglectibacter sp.]|uniref:DNA polymerase III subunit gamma/tau n=1 Tax=uncultured Neglectibacter sp. TaxID=1924108 RepID=UPI0034DE1F8D